LSDEVLTDTANKTKLMMPQFLESMLTGGINSATVVASYLDYRPGDSDEVFQDVQKRFRRLGEEKFKPEFWVFLDEGAKLRQLGLRFLKLVLKRSGLNEKEIARIYSLWDRKVLHSQVEDMEGMESVGKILLRDTAMTITAIEAEHQGITSWLSRNFGINYFGRYPENLLIGQYEKRENEETPYGIVAFPESDWSRTFHNDRGCLMQFVEDTQEKRNNRLFETSGVNDLENRLSGLKDKYGLADYGIIGGHGNLWGINLGDGKDGWFNIDVLRKGRGDLRSYFNKGATLMLFSCSTGKEGGIAQKISEQGFEVLAPDIDSSAAAINVSWQKNKPKFEVLYRNEAKCMRYRDGTRI
jgi:hypothetical protein